MISDDLKDALEKQILPNVSDETSNYFYHTIWTVVLRAENKMVADFIFNGEPNELGEVEIGYGTYSAFEGNGIMTEAIAGLVMWSREQKSVKSILAETEITNIASARILEKNNFIKEKYTETSFRWRFKL
jgi:RimJ/RimL family protein N-acetyltransferase